MAFGSRPQRPNIKIQKTGAEGAAYAEVSARY